MGPREVQERWWIYQFLEYKDGRVTEFEEARFFVRQDVLGEQSEQLLADRLAELRVTYAVEINEPALDALEVKVAPNFDQGTLPIDSQRDRGTER